MPERPLAIYARPLLLGSLALTVTLGSSSRTTTTAAAAQDGLLTFDEPVSQTIQEWRNDPERSAITIR